jgi:hypothetical protein
VQWVGGKYRGPQDGGYRIPMEWGILTEEQRAIMSVAGFKQSSMGDFLVQYEAFNPVWGGRLLGLWALTIDFLALVTVVAIWGVSYLQEGC